MKRRDCLVAGLVAGFGASALAQAADPDVAPLVEWPPIRLLDGSTLEPASWRGQGGVIVFWSTTCPFCKRHNAHVDKLYRTSRAQRLRVLGIAQDTDPTAVRDYMASNDYRFPVALDVPGLRAQLTRRRVIPMTCVVDRDSRLRYAIPGEMFEDDVLELGKIATRGAA
ncbi:MAG: TlpA disulfide reductase family protein [Burkholderiaceae bacterium]